MKITHGYKFKKYIDNLEYNYNNELLYIPKLTYGYKYKKHIENITNDNKENININKRNNISCYMFIIHIFCN